MIKGISKPAKNPISFISPHIGAMTAENSSPAESMLVKGRTKMLPPASPAKAVIKDSFRRLKELSFAIEPPR